MPASSLDFVFKEADFFFCVFCSCAGSFSDAEELVALLLAFEFAFICGFDDFLSFHLRMGLDFVVVVGGFWGRFYRAMRSRR